MGSPSGPILLEAEAETSTVNPSIPHAPTEHGPRSHFIFEKLKLFPIADEGMTLGKANLPPFVQLFTDKLEFKPKSDYKCNS